jgi:hypothetical protein
LLEARDSGVALCQQAPPGRRRQGLTTPGDPAAEAAVLNQIAPEGFERLSSP